MIKSTSTQPEALIEGVFSQMPPPEDAPEKAHEQFDET
jgi:hypothetical protein